MLEFSGEWRYDSPGGVVPEVEHKFRNLIERVCVQGEQKPMYEHFKRYFATAAGVQHFDSSSSSWASTDLDRVMSQAAENAPLFIEAFYDACEALEIRYPEMQLPGVERINRILSEHETGYYIDPPKLITNSEHSLLRIQNQTPTLDSEYFPKIEDALRAADSALRKGNTRQAIQEMLWALESTSTLFRDEYFLNGKIHGDYFNKIIGSLQIQAKGHQKQILDWMMKLHGYLSSPKGGGIRHGVDLRDGLDLELNEARLFCDLLRSYLTYLISEYKRLRQDIT